MCHLFGGINPIRNTLDISSSKSSRKVAKEILNKKNANSEMNHQILLKCIII